MRDQFEVVRGSGDLDAAYGIARSSIDVGDIGLAIEILEWLTELGHLEAATQLGFLLKDDGEVDRALALFAGAADAGLLDARLCMADLLSELPGRAGDAEREYRRVLGERPGDEFAMFNLALLLVGQGRLAEGAALFRSLADAGDQSAAVELVGSFLQAGDSEQANLALETYGSNLDAAEALEWGITLWSDGHGPVAERLFGTALRLGSHEAAAYLGVLYTESGRQVEAVDLYRRELAQGNTEVRLSLADCLLADPATQGEAEDLFRAMIADDEVEAYNNYGLVLWDRGDAAQAADLFRAGVERGDSFAMRNLALLLHELGNVAEAVEMMLQARHAGNTGALLEPSWWASDRGEHDTARQLAEEALALEVPGAENAMGDVLQGHAPIETVEAWFRKGADRGDSSAAFNLGLLLRNSGRIIEAAQVYREAIELGSVEALVNLASLLIDDGNIDEARPLLIRALELGDPLAAKSLAEIADVT